MVTWSSWIWVSSFFASWRMIMRSYSFRRTRDLGISLRKRSSFLSLWSLGDCFTLTCSLVVVWFGRPCSPSILASFACLSATILSSIFDLLAALFLFRVSFRLATMLTAEPWVEVGVPGLIISPGGNGDGVDEVDKQVCLRLGVDLVQGW